jgi:hypothetical protein
VAAIAITIEVDTGQLTRYDDAHLATLWHVAQANPAAHGDPNAGRLAEHIGREIIHRWLKATQPELWRHQGRDYYAAELRKLATYTPGAGEPGSLKWNAGTWTPRAAGPATDHCEGGPDA